MLRSLALLLVSIPILLASRLGGCPGPPVQPNVNYFYAGQFSTLHGVRTFDAWKRNPDMHCGGHPGEPDDAPTGGDDVLVGFRTWLNPDPKCTNTVIRSYRGYVMFDLTPLRGKENLYTGTATLDFDLASSSSALDGPNLDVCASTLAAVTVGWQPDPVPFEQDFVLPGTGFWPAGSTPAPITFPSTTAPGTRGPVQIIPNPSVAGHFFINVDPFVRVWLANSAANHGLVFTSINERWAPLPPTANDNCLGQFNNFMLRVYTY
jgi:hypothetical protein